MTNPDVISTKLVSKKVAYVYRTLWPAIIGLGCAQEKWQLQDLFLGARSLLDTVMEAGELSTDQVTWLYGPRNRVGDAVRELESKLLIYSEQVHTTSGAHAKRIYTLEPLGRKRWMGYRTSAGRSRKDEVTPSSVEAERAVSGKRSLALECQLRASDRR